MISKIDVDIIKINNYVLFLSCGGNFLCLVCLGFFFWRVFFFFWYVFLIFAGFKGQFSLSVFCVIHVDEGSSFSILAMNCLSLSFILSIEPTQFKLWKYKL